MWANEVEWGHSRKSSAGGKGVRVQTQFGGTPPPPLQARGEWGLSPCARRKQGACTKRRRRGNEERGEC